MRTIAHEAYPGHHLEAATKEAGLVDGEGRTELTLLSINTPECLLHEGLAELGYELAVPAADEAQFLVELYRVAGLRVDADPGAARALADTEVRVGRARQTLRGVAGNAGLLRHVDGRSRQEVIDYVVTVGRRPPTRAEQLFDHYVDRPFWRTCMFVYREGEQLLARWLHLAPASERVARFARLLAEARSPSSIAAELGEAPVRPS